MNGQRKVYGAVLTIMFVTTALDSVFTWFTLQKIIMLLLRDDWLQIDHILFGADALQTFTNVTPWITIVLADIILARLRPH